MIYNTGNALKREAYFSSSLAKKTNSHLNTGVITDGGVKPNIIPDQAELQYYLRAPTDAELSVLCQKVINCIQAAALATGCEVL